MTWFSIKDKTASMTEALSMYKEARAPRNYKQEYAQYHSKPQRVAERSQRNKARRKLGLAKGDPREVDHKNPISNGGSNARSNLRAVSLQANRRKFTKTANTKHHLITGVPGAGKSTLSRKLAKETGLPIYAMDDDPGIRDAFFNYQKTYAKTNDGRLDLSATRRALEDEIERRGIEKALKLKTPHIIEGSHFLRRKPEEFRDHKLIMVNPSAEAIAFQRTNRKKLKDLARGREWNPEIERQSRFRGQQLYDMYEAEGRADNWRNSSLVEKRAMLTPASALRMMKSNNKIVKGLGRLGSKIQIAATKPGVNKVVQSMADGAYGGTGFGVASGVGEALRQGSSTLKNSRLQNALELAGIADIAENHGTAITPLGHAYSYLMDSLPTAAEGISNFIG